MLRNLTKLTRYRGIPVIALLLLFCGFGGSVFGQLTVAGTIISDEGDPLIGVTIRVKDNLTTGTVTDFDGKYSITVPGGDSELLLSYTGYTSQTIKVNNRTTIDVTMETDAETLDEVVVVGYGYVDKKDLTGSVTTVKGEDLTRVQSIGFEQGLAAQAAGVQITTSQGGPGASATIRIRGGTSITASNDPLYVIDGFPLLGGSSGANAGPGSQSESPLSTINPNDIESIEVLKDASSTAIYGSRGANGVILITTKKGKEGRAQLTYSNSVGVGELSRTIDILSPQEYVDFWNEYHTFGIVNFGNRDLAYRDDLGNDLDLGDPESGLIVTNWRDKIFRNSFTQRHNLNINGGSDRTRYNASFGYSDDQGILEGSFYKRYSSNINVTQELANNLSAGININAGFIDRGGPVTAGGNAGGSAQASVLTQILLFTPVQGRIRYEDAEYDEDGILLSVRDGAAFNPQAQIERTHNFGNTVNGFGNAYLQYNFSDHLSVKSSFGGNYYNVNNEGVYPSDFGWSRAVGGIAFTGLFRRYGWLNENTVSYRNTFGIHSLNAVAGYTQQGSTNRNLSTSSQDFALPGVDIDALNSAGLTLPVNSGKSVWGLRSWLGRINYTLNDKYLITLSARADGSSRFAEGNKWGFFPSGAISWRVSQEPFLKDSKVISNLKLRATYGVSGNNGIGEYRSLAAYQPSRAVINGELAAGARVNQLGNTDLTWETTAQTDVGFELGLFQNRLTFDFDYYIKTTTDLLLQVPLPPETGFTSALQNFGEVENKGVELALNATPVDKGDFSWNFRINVSQNRNQVLDIGNADFILATSPGANENDFIVRVGEPIGSFYGYVTDGIYNYSDFPIFDGLSTQEAADIIRNDENGQFWDNFYELREGTVTRAGSAQYRPGMVKLKDIASLDENGNRIMVPDGVVDQTDRTILGNAQPDWYGGITNDFKYKNFDLSFLFQFSIGNEVYNNNITRGSATAIATYNKLGFIRDRWTLDNPDTDIPGIWGYTDGGVNRELISTFIEDGSFLRLANVTLGYRLPRGFGSTKNARIFAAVDNAFLLSDYTGYDPEVSIGNNPLTPGVDSDSYPRQRTYRAGLSVTF
ncbi:SusC/RagA family TonB-linked outer membrane protein [Neolewinella agarilytica]|uniref:SusC/RagA family TonB-linked outer membrane protein n=1 Tax=Neolewinella agarilytica TaxID=478744 RepID=UPI002354166A|nr:TonB-dependent receptor [Neolewinella agarilytica]